jgi:hypothetical protein
MQNKLLAAALLCAGLTVPCAYVHALMIAPPPGPVRIANSDAVFVGRVTAIQPVDVEAAQFPGAKEKVKYSIAIVEVKEAIRGLKGEKTIKIGFHVPAAPKPGLPRISGGGFRGVLPQVGQEGLYMINLHHEGKFYNAPNFGYFVAAADKNLDKEIKTAKQVVAIMANPKAALQSKDADERLMAASIQISVYRSQKAPFPNKEVAIDADETKLILDALMAGKWQPGRFGQTNAYQLFNQLGINAQDGWKAPMKFKDVDEVRQAAQSWLREHPEYRIKRFVPNAESK